MMKTTKSTKKNAVKSSAVTPAPTTLPAPKPAVAGVEPVKPLVTKPTTVVPTKPILTKPATTVPVTPVVAAPVLPKSNRISLELVQPDAKTVYVAGSFNEWKPENTPLVRAGNGHWVGDLAITPGRHEYLFVVDGQWLPDPNAKESVHNPFGGKNSVLVVSE